MKYIIAIAFIAFIAVVNAANIDIPDAHKEKAKQYVAECRDEVSISDEEYAKLKDGEDFEASENAKCFTNCFQEKAGILKDGVFQEATVFAKFATSVGEEKTKAIIDACRGETGSEKCETAYKLHKCYKKNEAY